MCRQHKICGRMKQARRTVWRALTSLVLVRAKKREAMQTIGRYQENMHAHTVLYYTSGGILQNRARSRQVISSTWPVTAETTSAVRVQAPEAREPPHGACAPGQRWSIVGRQVAGDGPRRRSACPLRFVALPHERKSIPGLLLLGPFLEIQ
jgi:hypothetical protein